eukprot:9189189-Lingulodinium_polyedra.AAC.1
MHVDMLNRAVQCVNAAHFARRTHCARTTCAARAWGSRAHGMRNSETSRGTLKHIVVHLDLKLHNRVLKCAMRHFNNAQRTRAHHARAASAALAWTSAARARRG